MEKLKNLCLGVLLKEGEDVFSLSPSEVGSIIDASILGDDIKIKFETSYGKPMDLIVKMNSFKKWASENGTKNVFKNFVIDFIEHSKEDEDLNEIVDDNGDIDLDGDMPNNSTNSMVVSPKFDLEKIYKKFIPKSIRSLSGQYGFGAIVW